MSKIADRIIALCGGPQTISEWLGISPTSVYRWTYPRSSGGSGGHIPQKHIEPLLEAAGRRGIPLTLQDFFDDAPLPSAGKEKKTTPAPTHIHDAWLAKAHTLSEALPYMRNYAGKTFVIKFGGHAMGKAELAKLFARDMVMLKQLGIDPIRCFPFHRLDHWTWRPHGTAPQWTGRNKRSCLDAANGVGIVEVLAADMERASRVMVPGKIIDTGA